MAQSMPYFALACPSLADFLLYDARRLPLISSPSMLADVYLMRLFWLPNMRRRVSRQFIDCRAFWLCHRLIAARPAALQR